MSNPQPANETATLQEAIDKILHEMQAYPAISPEFAILVKQLNKLTKIQSEKTPSRVNLESLLPVLGNLVGIVMILGFEKSHVITSKALSFVMKARV